MAEKRVVCIGSNCATEIRIAHKLDWKKKNSKMESVHHEIGTKNHTRVVSMIWNSEKRKLFMTFGYVSSL